MGSSGPSSARRTSEGWRWWIAAAVAAAVACDAGSGGGYAVTLEFVSPATPAERAAFERARQRIERVIVGDLPDVRLDRGPACSGVVPGGEVDDLLVLVDLAAIDGPGRIVGSAGPCIVRRSNGLPAVGLARFDTADLARLEERGTLDEVIVHELLHVVGFGVLWERFGLAASGATDPHFVGPGARAAFFGANGGGAYAGAAVPIEDLGASGTAGVHWREDVLGDELMTGWVTGTGQPLSLTTLRSLEDLGYEIDPAGAQPLEIAAPLQALLRDALPPLELAGDVLELPIVTVESED
jgi:hypothetical protein